MTWLTWTFIVGLPIFVLLLLYFAFNMLGRGGYSDPSRLKRELREAHGEKPETEKEEKRDREDWFGTSPPGKGWYGVAGLFALIGIVAALWLMPLLGIVLLALAAVAGIGLLFESKKTWKAASAGAILLLTAALILVFVPVGTFTGWWQTFVPSSFSERMSRCAAFSDKEQRCSFDDKAVTQASTGPIAGMDTCIYPLPPAGDYTLYKDGAVWYPGMPGSVSVWGFRSNHGSARVTYFLRPWGHCPPRP
ncbi:MAG TPA: hypothetical protein VHC68_03620 [Candidatus Paceibacterota bacterium]|nr:hypothetical protein [Candidatus Paceibacterota bacterium]